MNNIVNPVVITEKTASRDLEKIKSFHNDMLQNLAVHKTNVQAYQQQKNLEKQQESQMQQEQSMKDQEINQKNLDRQSNDQKASMDMNMKTKELELKKLAILAPTE